MLDPLDSLEEYSAVSSISGRSGKFSTPSIRASSSFYSMIGCSVLVLYKSLLDFGLSTGVASGDVPTLGERLALG